MKWGEDIREIKCRINSIGAEYFSQTFRQERLIPGGLEYGYGFCQYILIFFVTIVSFVLVNVYNSNLNCVLFFLNIYIFAYILKSVYVF